MDVVLSVTDIPPPAAAVAPVSATKCAWPVSPCSCTCWLIRGKASAARSDAADVARWGAATAADLGVSSSWPTTYGSRPDRKESDNLGLMRLLLRLLLGAAGTGASAGLGW